MTDNKKMINHTLRQLSLLGLGLYAEAEDKIKEYVDELVSEGEISKEEGKKFLAELRENSKKQKKEIDDKIRDKVSRTVEERDKKVKELEEKVRLLEEQLKEKGAQTGAGKKIIAVEDEIYEPKECKSECRQEEARPSGKTAAQMKNAEALRNAKNN